MNIQSLNLSSLKYFIDTVETGSFSKAAILNHVSRPAVSQSIMRLEEWAGFKILDHQKKSLILTEDGINFFRQAKQAFQNLESELKNFNKTNQTLKIGCSASLAEAYLIPSLKLVKDLSGLEIFTGTSTRLIEKLRDKTINVALIIDNPEQSEISTKIIKKGQFSLFSGTGRLEGTVFITEDRPEVLELKKWLVKNKISPNFVKVESWSLAQNMAKSLRGACLIPDFLVQSELKKVPMPGFKYSFQVLLAHQRRELLSTSEEYFCSLISKIQRS